MSPLIHLFACANTLENERIRPMTLLSRYSDGNPQRNARFIGNTVRKVTLVWKTIRVSPFISQHA